MCTTCSSGCGCGLVPVDCCCYPKQFCDLYKNKKAKLELETTDDTEIIFESDDDEPINNGYDVEENNYPLEQLEKDFLDFQKSKKFKDLHDRLFEQMKQKHPERIKKDPLPIVRSPSMSDMLTRGQLKDLIDSYEKHIEDLLCDVPCCEDDYPAYYEVEEHMKYFNRSGDFARVAYFYSGGKNYCPDKFDEFLQEVVNRIWENLNVDIRRVCLKEIFTNIFSIRIGGDDSWD